MFLKLGNDANHFMLASLISLMEILNVHTKVSIPSLGSSKYTSWFSLDGMIWKKEMHIMNLWEVLWGINVVNMVSFPKNHQCTWNIPGLNYAMRGGKLSHLSKRRDNIFLVFVLCGYRWHLMQPVAAQEECATLLFVVLKMQLELQMCTWETRRKHICSRHVSSSASFFSNQTILYTALIILICGFMWTRRFIDG